MRGLWCTKYPFIGVCGSLWSLLGCLRERRLKNAPLVLMPEESHLKGVLRNYVLVLEETGIPFLVLPLPKEGRRSSCEFKQAHSLMPCTERLRNLSAPPAKGLLRTCNLPTAQEAANFGQVSSSFLYDEPAFFFLSAPSFFSFARPQRNSATLPKLDCRRSLMLSGFQ